MTIYVVDLEPVETRYTGQWKSYVPKLLLEQTKENIMVIAGPDDIPKATTPGAFLNFGGTNVYKARQVEKIARMFCDGDIKDGDQFVFTDAWHPGIINLKYMSELLGIKVTTHGLWHAGSYDPQDFLGRLIGDEPWIRCAEETFFYAFDHNYFATDFHIDMFLDTMFTMKTSEIKQAMLENLKIVQTGWPMDYMAETMREFQNEAKTNTIVFPHRIAPEKQVEIFKDLEKSMPQYDFVVCQEMNLTKDEYHQLLSEAKMVFSCALQETLGIVGYEGAILGAIPLVPDRLSYAEMYDPQLKYPSEWTESWDSYMKHKGSLMSVIETMMDDFESYEGLVSKQVNSLTSKFFSAKNLIKVLNR